MSALGARELVPDWIPIVVMDRGRHSDRADTQGETHEEKTHARAAVDGSQKEAGEDPSEEGGTSRPAAVSAWRRVFLGGRGARGAVVGDVASRGGGGPGPRLKAMGSTPPGRQPICLRIAFGQEVICVDAGRSPGDGDGVVTFYLVEKGVDEGKYELVRYWSDRAGA